ncbi:MAG TPA: diphosphate--fructose-6-phosphate 1-phosphotransferase, partial [Rhabdochlamydiaceae bacterium]|nr:diphosphate--fructose-6-phosphate 1-phosphotransferase [Rhabdochlamydiaceae bacterium]
MQKQLSLLQKLRQEYVPPVPLVLRDLSKVRLKTGDKTTAVKDIEALKQQFPLTFGQPLISGEKGGTRTGKSVRIGVVFSGGQAAGG